jgi:fucose permease
VLFLNLPKWKNRGANTAKEETAPREPLSLPQILKIRGAKEVMVAFFCYCALEGTAMLWGSTYFVRQLGMDPERAASLGAMFFIGITTGRFLSGFLTMKMNDPNMIRLGQVVITLGVVMMLLPLGEYAAIAGLLLIGFGCAPIYPCIIHSTPDHFGEDNSQAIIGVQMASAYLGSLSLPPLFGLIANHLSVSWMPFYMGAILVLMVVMCEELNRKTK